MLLGLLFSEENGQMLVENALILLMAALVATAGLHDLGGSSNDSLNNSARRYPRGAVERRLICDPASTDHRSVLLQIVSASIVWLLAGLGVSLLFKARILGFRLPEEPALRAVPVVALTRHPRPIR